MVSAQPDLHLPVLMQLNFTNECTIPGYRHHKVSALTRTKNQDPKILEKEH